MSRGNLSLDSWLWENHNKNKKGGRKMKNMKHVQKTLIEYGFPSIKAILKIGSQIKNMEVKRK